MNQNYILLPESEWIPSYSYLNENEPASWLIGYTDDEIKLPIFKTADWYKARLDAADARSSQTYRGRSRTSEELDEECTAVSLHNKLYGYDPR